MPASPQRRARRARDRRMRAMGVNLVERSHFKPDTSVDDLAWYAAEAFKTLAMHDADIAATVAITVGEHPEFPGVLTIEAKGRKREACDCPIDHGESEGDDDGA